MFESAEFGHKIDKARSAGPLRSPSGCEVRLVAIEEALGHHPYTSHPSGCDMDLQVAEKYFDALVNAAVEEKCLVAGLNGVLMESFG